MTSWIVFARPPTATEARAAIDCGGGGRGEWTTSVFRFKSTDSAADAGSPEDESTAEWLSHSDIGARPAAASALLETANRRDLSTRSHDPEKEVSGANETSFAAYQRQPYAAHGVDRSEIADRPSPFYVKEEEPSDLDLRFASDLEPPPAQKRRRVSYGRFGFAPTDLDRTDETSYMRSAANHTTADLTAVASWRTDDSYEPTYRSNAGIGPPPEFPFRRRDLLPLNEVAASAAEQRQVSVLATVWNIKQRDAGSKRLHEWSLLDSSGQNCPFILWESDVSDTSRQVRLGDVVFLGSVTAGTWANRPQLKHRRGATRIHICWRTNLLDPDDERYRFHRGWASEVPEAQAVLDQVDYAAARLA
ncbi:hypothetical protein JCM8202_005505 [Rhodotorula sphaerocarpa]